jgi:hypothetical protein
MTECNSHPQLFRDSCANFGVSPLPGGCPNSMMVCSLMRSHSGNLYTGAEPIASP